MTDVIKDQDYYRANRHLFMFPVFTLDTHAGLIEFVMAIPKDKYDAFKIMEMLDARETDNKKPPEGGFLNSQQ